MVYLFRDNPLHSPFGVDSGEVAVEFDDMDFSSSTISSADSRLRMSRKRLVLCHRHACDPQEWPSAALSKTRNIREHGFRVFTYTLGKSDDLVNGSMVIKYMVTPRLFVICFTNEANFLI